MSALKAVETMLSTQFSSKIHKEVAYFMISKRI